MRGTEFLLRSLVADGVDHVFMVPGGLIDPFYPALQAVPELTPIVAAQEGGAAYAADGYARASGGMGACLVIGGPGLTNAVTAVSTALTDGVPMLVIAGRAGPHRRRRGVKGLVEVVALCGVYALVAMVTSAFAVPVTEAGRH